MRPAGSASAAGSRAERRDDVVAGRHRGTSPDAAHNLRRGHAPRSRPGVHPAALPCGGRREAPARRPRDEQAAGVWRVWLDESPVTDPIVLPGSHKRWQPIVTAESWNGGVSTCNGFRFRFERVGVARHSAARGARSCPASRSVTRASSSVSSARRRRVRGRSPSTPSRPSRSTRSRDERFVADRPRYPLAAVEPCGRVPAPVFFPLGTAAPNAVACGSRG